MPLGPKSAIPVLAALWLSVSLQGALAGEFTVEAITIPEMKAVFGQVESRTVVPARARIGGTIASIDVTEGSGVTEGAVIGRVVDDKLALQIQAAEARAQQANSQLVKAKADLDRAQQLVSKGVSSQAQLDQAQSTYDVAVNQLAAAEADKAVVRQQSNEGDILAPATGRVLTVPITLGSVVLAGETIARVASGGYYLRLSLPERHAASIREGDSVMIGGRGLAATDGAGKATLRTGRIAKVYPEITDGRVTADVEVSDIGDYFVGERTLVSIPIGSRSALAVPPAAVETRHGLDTVRLASGDAISVILGEHFVSNGDARVEILTGLKAGDIVTLPDAAQ
ncbi:efflux RND transporter periplasmic adaptor subunit [Mesorhizobium sp. BR1-1-16]|uniref:efflux RND transporter periplasmic adaptor subunit n=1 Tax=Mesorhizobium sp. BR1-1-16 TaxID=2876653 RepID=UPI001CCA8B7F|nr:efflux RND transporter periplasmic adaptor subunit [Mesorhizobium sp. BR1-1-16]MBZ9938159.1 efflux RND transporter periplasmic adaptor subunit [Mesorhizobium sp. BR1-1-16]